MTPPLTDTELLAYIERTPELRAALIAARLYANQLFEEPYIPPDTRRIARAFHAHEQRVREEQHRATVKRCADVCEQRADNLRDGSAIARQCAKDVLSQMDVLAKQGGK